MFSYSPNINYLLFFLVDPDAAASVELVPPDSDGAGSRLPDSGGHSGAAVGRLPDLTSLAKRKRPPVASPAGGAPHEMVASVSARNP
eukprot:2552482-Amphidinium_carterae.1